MNRAGIITRTAWAISPLLLILAVGCGGNGSQNKETGNTMDKWTVREECDFARLKTGPLEENTCSPRIEAQDFIGIAINAPEEVFYEPGETVEGTMFFADVRICGTTCFGYDFMGLKGRLQGQILLVAVDAKTQETWSGKMVTVRNPVPRPEGMEQGGGPTEGLLMETYFNPNLVETLELPERPAEYIVYAVLGEYKSNTVRIRVLERS